jgi:catechol 2,3-dioxygenase-like lactoylglutathione lyase family enzyme
MPMKLLVNIDVPDLNAAREFYCAAFGLTVGRRLGEGVLELIGGPAPIYLLETIGHPGNWKRRRGSYL